MDAKYKELKSVTFKRSYPKGVSFDRQEDLALSAYQLKKPEHWETRSMRQSLSKEFCTTL